MHRLLESHGEIGAVGIEGCGSWGAGLSRHLTEHGVRVIEVNRPNRQTRRRRGKSDTVDAVAAARAVLNGDASATPKTGAGPVEALRQLRVARSGAIKARTAAANQLHSLCDTAPEQLRAQMLAFSFRQKIATAGRFRCGEGDGGQPAKTASSGSRPDDRGDPGGDVGTFGASPRPVGVGAGGADQRWCSVCAGPRG